ncbi:MAG: response regulator transcription factor [Arcobacteraceae bacterium]|nr:response regulator transcription factor [Arcobacteraceae bacterium]
MNSNFLKELKVLLVEDEKNLAKLLKDAIGDSFYSFTVTNNGKEGLKKFLEISPDLVITDIMMPDLTGLEMASELKQINPNIPIIILSAFSDKDKFLNAIDVGVIKYFIKPFDPDELLDYINSISSEFEKKLISLIDEFKFNRNSCNLYKNDKYVTLTKRESQFLLILLQSHKNIITAQTIKNKLWENEEVSDERLRTFIKRLRLKTSKRLIQNIKGQGYQLTLE